MTAVELDRFERRWKRVFAVAAAIVVICLLEVLTLSPGRVLAAGCYVLASLAAAVGLFAAKALRDLERVHAIVDGQWLNGVHAPDPVDAADGALDADD